MQSKAQKLADHVKNLAGFSIATEIDGNYQNMGATIIDGVLQSGITYETVVKPRVRQYLSQYALTRTTTEFKALIDKVTVPALIRWKDSAKTRSIERLTTFLIANSVETEAEFKVWLGNAGNIARLKTLPGIKDKTADYFKILTGYKTNAIDRHLLAFLAGAGIQVSNYREAQEVISGASEILGIDEAYFDHSIWTYMSESRVRQNSGVACV